MKILVLLKQILNPAGMTVNRKAGRVFVNKEEFMVNPADQRALEAALRIKDSDGAEVIAVAVDPAQPDSVNSLRAARALGADRAIYIPTGSIDSAGIIRALAALINQLGEIGLVITGQRALDTGQALGPGLAEALGWPCLSAAVECSIENDAAQIVRVEAGQYYRYEVDLPAVITVTRAGPAPRYPHGGNIITYYRDPKAIEIIGAADLGLIDSDLAPATAERGQSFPPEREFGKPATVDEILALIQNS